MLTEKICDWLEGRLDDDESAQVAFQIEQEPELAAQVEWVRRVLEDAGGIILAEPPPSLRPSLESLFDSSKKDCGLVKRYHGEPLLDLQRAGMRSAGEHNGNIKHLLFSCQLLDVSITLRQNVIDDRNDLKGQILAPAGLATDLCSVELKCNEGGTRLAEADETGEFVFQGLPEGRYRVIVLGPGFEVSTPDFPIA